MTTVALIRHGEVENPAKILYGRLPGYHLSTLGQRMAERVADWVADWPHPDDGQSEGYGQAPPGYLAASPLERAQQTLEPIAARLADAGHEPRVATDERLIEAGNLFEGKRFGVGDGALREPSAWWKLRNPFRPSWGEPYRAIVVRMLAAMDHARRQAEAVGGDALLVSHQLPIWTVRSYVQGRRLWHDPRCRECALASVTGFRYDGERIVDVWYTEPAGDLLPGRDGRFVAGA